MTQEGPLGITVEDHVSGLATVTIAPTAPWQPANPDTDKLLVPAAKVVPFLGAGVSTGAGLPSGADICQRLCSEFNATGATSPDPRTVATDIVRSRRATARQVKERVARLYENASAGQTPALVAIARVPSRWVVTLNYDGSIEQTASLLGIQARPYTWYDLPPWEQAISGAEHPLNVLHLHGWWKDPDSIVLDEDTYRAVENDDRLKAYLSPLLLHHNACFVGTRLDEPYIVKFLSALPANEPKHVFFAQGVEQAEIESGRLAVTTSVHNVIFEPFPDGDWKRLDDLCQHYFAPVESDFSALSAADFVVPAAPELYVAPTLVRRSGEAERTPEVLAWSIELGQEEAISARDVSVRSRTLIVGRPGSGKTALLQRAAGEVPADERALYIRLSGVGEIVGDPVALLIGWGRVNQSPNAQRELTAEDFELQRFHFLLDGLDEVPSGRQGPLAARITDIARALPQHRFTVTSRPVPAVNGFDPAEWELLELVTSAQWRSEFLRRAGVTEEQLLEAVPALADLNELLNLPFFLTAVVELYKDGRLPDGADLMSVITALIERALSAADIELVRDAVRPWLRDVAFTMQAAARNALNPAELSGFELPPGLNLGPDEDVVDLLIRRSLLERAGGEIHFVHRLVADALSAEKLIELGPAAPGLLEMVAPSTQGVSGTRSDWMVVLMLAGSASPAWRAAIAERDPIAAARMVPASALVDERRDAALRLWHSYVASRVWMHNRDGARVLRDSDIVGQLLRPGDLPDVVDEILGGIHNESPQVRSNALEVLGAAGLDAELEPLVRASLSGEREEVVRRQAIAVASQRSLFSAFPLVKHRALTSTDDLEVQVAVVLGLRLAPDDQLLDFALELISAGREHHWAVDSVVLERLGPEAALEVVRAHAERGEYSHLLPRVLKTLAADLPDTDRVAEQLACIVANGRDLDVVKSRLIAHPEAAMRGLVAAVNERPRLGFEVMRVMRLLPVELVDDAEFNDERLKEVLKQALAPRPESEEDVTAIKPEEQEEQVPAQASLRELLMRPDSEAEGMLLQHCLELAPQVKGLTPEQRADLERRVKERWWPQDGFAGVITDSRITWKAHASLAYGSQLCLPLTDEDWGEIAGFGMPYEGKVEWLRGNYRRSAATSAAERWTDDRPERWVNLADAIPTKLPPAVVRAIAGHVKTADLFLPRLLGRLLDERHMTALRELAKISGQVGEDADRYVARAGDFRAQGRCLDHLIGDFGTPKSIHADDLRWTDGILDARLLPKLFEALVAAYRHRNADYNDAMTPIHEAIRRIDGLDAVRRYDELMASEPPAFPGVQFERYERDTILDDILRATGEEATAPLLATLGLPRL